MSLRNPSILESVAQDEMDNPSPRKHLYHRDIYLSRNYWALSPNELGRSVITDFGLAVRGDEAPNSHPIQPDEYRAPEVCLGCEWSYSVDIWNLGVMLWDLFYGHSAFDMPQDLDRPVSADKAYLGQIISLLGPPPPELLSQGKKASNYFDAQGMLSGSWLICSIGQFKFPELIKRKDLLSIVREIDDDNGIPEFVDFCSQILRWKPEDRSTAEDLLSHPWLPQMKAFR
ncbi:protein kinase [Penicillium malachiteum]|uniref:protein kinase n=1 Tax=Penicillium malachiteum TaxID=1324776 RepID=UPI0025465E8B|nr:protein kinase [Penicillium malachiteum]KAJ5736870.1 protein kinase [Penicillium malachiteum]